VDDLTRALAEEIPDAMTRDRVPGLAIGIRDADGRRWSAAFGSTQRGGGLPITTATRFSVQSTSKLVTATAVLHAVRSGLLDLDAPITDALPGFTVNSAFEDDASAQITLRHLLAHTAGLTHEAPDGSNYDLGSGDFDAHCESIAKTWLRFPVGHHFEYSNLGIDLAGWALERTAGTSLDAYARATLFARLGMTRATYDARVVASDPARAVGHWAPFEAAGRALPITVPMVPSGGLFMSLDDAMGLLGLFLRGGAVDEQLRVAFPADGQRLGYGLGVYVDEWAPGVRVLHHGGSGFGFQAQLFWAPDLGIGAAILTNSFDHDLQNALARRIVAALAGGGGRHAEEDGPPDDRVGRDDVAGRYVGRLDDGVTVTVVDGRLRIDGAPADAQRHRFLTDADGTIAYMMDLRDGGVRYRDDAALTPPSTLDPARAKTYIVRNWGVETDRCELAQNGASPVLRRAGAEVGLRLRPIGTDLYMSSTGEVLDLRGERPTYANIVLE
jgi:CubicO group peptidase (beta-lactamase class C family)